MDWIPKMINFVTAKSQNELFDYLKFVIYQTDDAKVVEKKDLALDYLFNGLAFLEKKKYQKSIDFIQSAINIYEAGQDDLRKAIGLFFMGAVFQDQEKKDIAKDYFEKARVIFKEKENKMQYACENKIKEMEL